MIPKLWTPHNYQLTAESFLLSNPKSGLFLDPGLGKTSISLAVMKILKYSGSMKGVLLVAPLRVIHNVWPEEIFKWLNFNCLSYTILHEGSKKELWGEQKDIYLINPEGLKWLYKELLEELQFGNKCPFNVLWIDESTKFKNPLSEARFLLLKDMLPLFKRIHIMTGTPAPRALLDLWSQIYLLDRGESLTDNYYHFRKKYFEADDWNKYKWNIKDFADTIIHDKIAPLILDMSAEDHLDMPELIYNDIKIELPKKAFKYYKRMEREFFIEIEGLEASAEATAQAGMKCHQIANGNVYEDIPKDLDEDGEREFRKTRKVIHIHKSKLEALKDLIDELNGKPLLIAYHYRHDLEAIRGLLGSDIPHIGSGVNPEETERLKNDWNAGKFQYLVGHPASMSHGLNMQSVGRHVCWYSLTWNLEDYMQFIRRIYRQGVSGSVTVHHLISKGTTDEAMLSRLGARSKDQLSLRKALKEYRKNLI